MPTAGGWVKFAANPVLGGALGTCFDIALLREGGRYRMWFSWRPRRCIALAESADGIAWGEPRPCLGPVASGWEDEVNRPAVLRREDGYHMWYTGQSDRPAASRLGYARSADGVCWTRVRGTPVLEPAAPWEGVAIMCPHVLWDAGAGLFRMWYSAGEQYEPNAIGHATSADGIRWDKHRGNPVFDVDPAHPWERHKVTACQVVPHEGGFAMFYIGFQDEHTARIGLAWSPDGLGPWLRHPANPLVAPDEGAWDAEACYKPFAIREGSTWRLWYNGRRGDREQIGLALHHGADLGLPPPAEAERA